ncbi:hypothetical protein [Brevibacillus choshinensis]|uniref:hypothetical protein n=1 Tax=Brevibacillus choshinensis TaxID=54911 RepID=UPI000A91C4C1|nr:hypothetical protein [Brevibacillus choshinensis]
MPLFQKGVSLHQANGHQRQRHYLGTLDPSIIRIQTTVKKQEKPRSAVTIGSPH